MMRNDVHERVNEIALTLGGAFVANLESGRVFSSVVATEPNMDEKRFNELASRLFHEYSSMRAIATAPNLVVDKIYPRMGNEGVIGLDYRKAKEQRDMVLKARDTGSVTLAGPVKLVQGGSGVIIRYPVFTKNGEDEKSFWGVVSSVIDMDNIYRFAGIYRNNDLDFAFLGKDGKGVDGDLFFGTSAILDQNPVYVKVRLAYGEWQLLAVPKEGWVVPSRVFWLIRSVACIAFLLVVVPIGFVTSLMRERVAHLNKHIRSQTELNQMTTRLGLVVDAVQLGIWEYDASTKHLEWDLRMKKIFGRSESYDPNNGSWKTQFLGEDLERVAMHGFKLLGQGKQFSSVFRIHTPDGKHKTVKIAAFCWTGPDGLKKFIGVNWDISDQVAREKALSEARGESERRYRELEQAKTRIEFNSRHDFLTRLPNRRYLDQYLNGEGEEGHLVGPDPDSWVLKIDLDGFKEINDSFGHAAGDRMLILAADILRRISRQGEFIARVGGDEFVLLCDSKTDRKRPQELAEQFIQELQEPHYYKGLACRLSASVGIANWADAKGDPDKLRSNADLALYQSKQSGKARYTFFSQPLFNKARDHKKLTDDLMRGIEEREFVAHFQGQYCAKTHKLIGAEALARWNHPTRGLIFPDQFIELAEGMGITGEIDALIMDQALEARNYWAEQDLEIKRISVNVSAKRLGNPDLIPSLKKLDFDPTGLTFELVESTFLDRSDAQVAANIRQLRDMGIDIEIDDFGTAYASIVSLTHLLPNRLKIDRELILPVTSHENQRELVHSIINIGRTLGIGTVAEGIETMEHAEILRIMGVDRLQGYAFSKPMNRDDFLKHHLQLSVQVQNNHVA
ncbi:EAL domain-containing protein [uncultured Cohaesibacter sp.]|uniref:EAL domain-containing protein n=1 Tax=uncultured Cohaesibacter sp. TaxID=1002546 RepID=UPI002931A9C4|nr:EAL domain-containing protein [uncultured Cohaesibacter sp.]